jgi:hypothetical protein
MKTVSRRRFSRRPRDARKISAPYRELEQRDSIDSSIPRMVRIFRSVSDGSRRGISTSLGAANTKEYDEAKEAMQQLDGKEINGRPIKMSEARERSPGGGNFR